MHKLVAFALALSFTAAAHDAGAQAQSLQDLAGAPSAVRIRYIVDDVATSTAFYSTKLGFHVDAQSGSYFAALSRGGVQLLLSPTKGPGGASQPLPDGRRPAPGGWTRLVLNVANLESEIERLRKDGVTFRSGIIRGPGGREVVLDDPSGNPVELFQPG